MHLKERDVGKLSRNKGASYERHIAKQFQQNGWYAAKRHLEVQAAEAFGRDLDGTEPFAVQAKCWRRTPSISAIEEIELDGDYEIPMAILKRTQSKGTKMLEVAVLPLDVVMRMLGILRDIDALDDLL